MNQVGVVELHGFDKLCGVLVKLTCDFSLSARILSLRRYVLIQTDPGPLQSLLCEVVVLYIGFNYFKFYFDHMVDHRLYY